MGGWVVGEETGGRFFELLDGFVEKGDFLLGGRERFFLLL